MIRRQHTGFTLIELVVALTVAAVLLGVGVPSFVSVVKSSRTGAAYSEFAGHLFRARSEAVRSASIVTVCARASDTACGDDWNAGALVFADAPPVAAGATAGIGGEDTILAAGGPVHDAIAVRLIGSPSGNLSDVDDIDWISYRGDGATNQNSASLVVCDDRGPSYSRALNVVLTGDLRRARAKNDETVPRDVFGRALGCPEPGG